ncbi:uncharacterized protein [Euphorbia lathyris]|uniref:uncharacterized protein n=1 Tax=Euphorbia lathyris TaxID=212925 RepID=UPI003313EB27
MTKNQDAMNTNDPDSRKRKGVTNSNGVDHDDSSDFLALKLAFPYSDNDKAKTPAEDGFIPPSPQVPIRPPPEGEFIPPSPQFPLRPPPEGEFIHQQLQSGTLIAPSPLFQAPPVGGDTLKLNHPSSALASGSGSASSSTQHTHRSSRQRVRRTVEDNKPFPPPFPWASDKRAIVRNIQELAERKIETITGLVQCRRCEKQYEIGYNLKEKFYEVASFIAANKDSMHDRAPAVWMSPVLPTCKFCEQENSVKPVISEKKKTINWLFLLLGQMLGCCTLDQLKYFCKHTENHRTGAKDRVLYLTYLGLCKQVDSSGPFYL